MQMTGGNGVQTEARRVALRPPGSGETGRSVHVPVILGGIVLSVLLSAGGPVGVLMGIALGVAPLLVAALVGVSVRAWIVVLLVATCINGIRIPLGGFNLLPEHFVICGVLLVLLLRMPAAILRPPAAFELLLLMWIAWNGLVSVVLAPEPHRSLPIVAWLLLSWMILWAVRGYLLQAEKEDADAVRRALLVIGATAGFIAFALWILGLAGWLSPAVQPEPYTQTVAARGFSYEANILGSQELFIVIAGLAFVRSRAQRVPSIVWVGLSVGILSTMTRAVWVAAIVVVGFEFLRRRHREPMEGGKSVTTTSAWLLVACLALLPFVFISADNPIFSRFKGSLDLSSGTAQLRIDGVKEALGDMKGAALVTGLGTNSFGQRHRNVLFVDKRGYLSVLPLVVLYDTGFVGGILIAGACAALFLKHSAPAGRRYARTFLLVLLITGSATNPIWFGITWVLIAIVGVPRTDATEVAGAMPVKVA